MALFTRLMKNEATVATCERSKRKQPVSKYLRPEGHATVDTYTITEVLGVIRNRAHPSRCASQVHTGAQREPLMNDQARFFVLIHFKYREIWDEFSINSSTDSNGEFLTKYFLYLDMALVHES
jgi:hypothetical protein